MFMTVSRFSYLKINYSLLVHRLENFPPIKNLLTALSEMEKEELNYCACWWIDDYFLSLKAEP